MYKEMILPVILVSSGLYFVIYNIQLVINEKKLHHYLTTSPKARFWVSKHGVEKAAFHTRTYFLPIGILVGCCIFSVGVKALFMVLFNCEQ
jgi:hypothetical protein